MAPCRVKLGTALTLFLGAGMFMALPAATASSAACEIGAYRSADGDALVLTQRGDKYRYTLIDGRYGYVSDPDARVSCASRAVTVAGADGEPEVWPKAPLRVTNTTFESNGAKLVGQLIEPAGQGEKPPLVVMVHGSERTGWIGRVPYPWIAAVQGVSAFIFDKRGTGMSEGEYTQNFTRLAEDVVAASAEARRLGAGRFSRIGLFGGSQGGWIAPLAARKAGAEFLVVGFGLILSPLEEDAEQVYAELKSKGYGRDVLEKARAVTDATGAVMACHFECGFEQLAAVKQAYGKEPWMREIRGEFTGDLLEASEKELRETGRAELDNLDIEWRFDSMPVLRDLSIPQLWVLAGKDREAPGKLTEQRLDILRREGKPIEVVLFPDADHGITEFVTLPDGTRDITRIAEGYFRLVADWMKGTMAPPYGNSRAVPVNAPEPKLIVAISVDQFSSNLFREYRPYFTGGLKRLAGGVVFADGFQAHAATETCPGHSTILTGAHPARTGIVAAGWVDDDAPREDKTVYCAEDESVPGTKSDDYRVSAVHLGVPTLGDRLKAADPRSRVISVSIKDTAAVMLGGQRADQILFISRNGYVGPEGTTPAPVVADVNQQVLAKVAKPLPPMTLPDVCKPRAVEVVLPNGRTIGTHRFAREAGDKAAFFLASPEADAATLTLAAALIRQLQLGRGAATDLVAISLSATDFIGHRYGTGGVEMCLQITALDAELSSFFEGLDETGIDYAVVLTADHGGLDVPARLRVKGITEAARVEAGATPAGVGKEIASRLDLAEPVFIGGWYVAPSVPEARRAEVLALARELLSAHPQVHSVYDAAVVAEHPMPEGSPSDWSILDRLRASWHPTRSGDLLVVLQPHIGPAADPGEVGTHGTPWDYDRKVPILFWWKGITPGDRREGVMTVDIMPTLASLIGLAVPTGEIDGRCLDILTGPETNCPR